MSKISVCMIMKNEEQHIFRCLAPLKEAGFELVIVDTGSTDSSMQLCSRFTDQLYPFHWCDDFSAARNYSISKALGDYILVVDFDEYLEAADLQQLHSSLIPEKIGTITRKNPSLLVSGQASVMTEQVGRFFHKKYYHYEGVVHEQLVPNAAFRLSPSYYPLPLTFFHHGYESADSIKEKAGRNLSLLLLEYSKKTDDPYILYQIGKCYQVLKDYKNACCYYDKALSLDLDLRLIYVHELVEAYGYCLLSMEDYSGALSLLGIYDAFSQDADFIFLIGLIYMNNACFDQAIHEFQKATSYNRCRTEGVTTFLAHYNIGVIYECTGRISEGLAAYRKCGNYPPAISRLTALTKHSKDL